MICPNCKEPLFISLNSDEIECINPSCQPNPLILKDPGVFFGSCNSKGIYKYSILLSIDDIWYNLYSGNFTSLSKVDIDNPDINVRPALIKLPVFFKLDNYEEMKDYMDLTKRLLKLIAFS